MLLRNMLADALEEREQAIEELKLAERRLFKAQHQVLILQKELEDDD